MRRLFGILLVLATPLLLSAGDDDAQKELKALQGKWKAVALEAGGKPLPKKSVPDFLFIVGADGKSTGQMGKIEYQAKVSVDPKKNPKTIDNVHETGAHKGKKQFGIYKVEGGKWIVCMTAPGAAESDRPKTFDTKDTGNVVFIFERVREEGDKGDGKKDLESLQGTWNIDTQGWSGKDLPKELTKGYKFVFAGNKLTWDAAIGMMSKMGKITANAGTFPCDFKIDPSKKPKQIDITLHLKRGDATFLGIYEIKGDALTVCYFASNTGKRPTEFSSKDEPNVGFISLTRAMKAD